MHTRPTTRADLPGLLRVSIDAFLNDETNAYLWPHRHAHPSDYRATLAHSARTSHVTPALHSAVTLSDDADATALPGIPPGTVLGFAWWIRTATPPACTAPLSATQPDAAVRASEAAARAHNTGPAAALERTLLALEAAYRACVAPDRSACAPDARAALVRAEGTQGALDGLPGHWSLRLLGVHPECRRRGVAGALVEFGLRRAQGEGVPAALGSSLEGMSVYARYGFRVVDWVDMPGGMHGGAVMVWDPWRMWVEDLPEGEEIVVRGRVMGARVKGAVVKGAGLDVS